MTDLLTAAVRYAEHGWAVFPLRPRSKHPLHKDAGGFHEASKNPQVVADWWASDPNANIGLAPGRSNLLIADVDGTTAESTARALGLLDDPTLTVETGRPDFPGRHLYFRHPGGHVGNLRLALLDGRLTSVGGLKPGLEVKADAGYVLLPPSIHPSGKTYRFLQPDDPVRELPSTEWLHLAAQEKAPIPAQIQEGTRDVSLFRLGCAMRRLGAAEAVILAALRGVNRDCVRPPMSDEEVIQKAQQAAKYLPVPPREAVGSVPPTWMPKRARL